MCGYIPFTAERNDRQKVGHDKIIKQGVSQQTVRDDQKYCKANYNGSIYDAMNFISFLTFVLWEHADANHDIGDDNQNSG